MRLLLGVAFVLLLAGPARAQTDVPDTSCTVVLRSITAPTFDGQSQRSDYIWTGVIDVDEHAIDVGARVGVEWVVGTQSFAETVNVRLQSQRPGVERFEFKIDRDTLPVTASVAQIRAFQVEVIPFVRMPDGHRLLDHNRSPDGTYELWSGHGTPPAGGESGPGFSIPDDPAICS
jgi:hypothetical protein